MFAKFVGCLAAAAVAVTASQGLARAEGKEYVVQDGDVMLFRFSS